MIPGLVTELDELPAHLRRWSFHNPEWWHRHWERSGVVELELAELEAQSFRADSPTSGSH